MGIPDDPLFELLSTSLALHVNSAGAVANALLEFFDGELACTVEKVSLGKFSMKIKWHSDGIWCVLKVRLYSHSSNVIAEFQRRSGDALVFQDGYDSVAQFLTSHFGGW